MKKGQMQLVILISSPTHIKMIEKSLDSIFKKKWEFFQIPTLPIFLKDKTTKVEPCSLISSKTWKEYESPDIAFIFAGGATEIPADDSSSGGNSKSEDSGSNSVKSEQPRQGWKKFTGILLALFATFIYSLATLVVKLFHNQYHPFVLSIWRFQGMIIPSIPIILYYLYGEKKPLFKSVWPLTEKKKLKAVVFIIMRSVVGCMSSVLQIFAVQKLNMADASIIVFSSPVFVTFAAHIFLGEKAGVFSILTALFTLGGVAVIARPPILTGASLDSETLIGTLYALGSMILAVIVFIILRYLREVHYSVVTLSYGILGTLESVLMAGALQVFDVPHGLWEWSLAGALILCTFLGQTAMVISLKFENAGPVSLIGTTDVVFAFLWQFIFLSTLPDLYSAIGAFIVILGVMITTFRKWGRTLPEDHKLRTKLDWFF